MLSDLKIRQAKPTEKDYRISDFDGLYIIVKSSGRKLWRFDYILNGRRNTMSFGRYPETGLLSARAKRDETRAVVSSGKDPVHEKRVAAAAEIGGKTFGDVGEDYITRMVLAGRAEKTLAKARLFLRHHAAPISKIPVGSVTPVDVLNVLRPIEKSGRISTASDLRAMIGSVFRLAIVDQLRDDDPTYSLRGAIVQKRTEGLAAIVNEVRFGALLRSVDDYPGWITLRAAMQIMALCYPRPVELRMAEWSAIDFKQAIWELPPEITKMREPHNIPLSRQALSIFRDLHEITGNGRLVFPQLRASGRPISENAMNSALRRMGIEQSEHCSHGFRSSASTLLNKHGFDDRVIETSLSHVDSNKVRRAYNRYKYWDERVAMAQAWADLCDKFKKTRRDHSDLV